jgi:hypothetical protein
MKPEPKQITPAQLHRLQAEWHKLARQGDPRACQWPGYKGEQPHHELMGAEERERTARLEWASGHLARPVESFSALTVAQASYLLDVLFGKRPKVWDRLHQAAATAGIQDLAAWYEALIGEWRRSARTPRCYWRLKEKATLAELGMADVWWLCRLLETRKVGPA